MLRIISFWKGALLVACAVAFCAVAPAAERAENKSPEKKPPSNRPTPKHGPAKVVRTIEVAPPKSNDPAVVVDHYLDARLKAEGVTPAPQVDDANLIRRLMLDLVGRIPTPVELHAYVDSRDPNKREQLVDRLLASPEFIGQQVNEFDWMLTQGQGSVREYLSTAFREGRAWDRVFRDLTLADDEAFAQKGAADFMKPRLKDSDLLTNDVSRLFFGVNISCAQCHDHPLAEDWKQAHFYGLKSFFSRTFAVGDFVAEREYGDVTYQTPKGESFPADLMFLTGFKVPEPKVAEPDGKAKKAEQEMLKKLTDKKQAPPRPKFSRRAQLAETALRGDQRQFFARSIVNRQIHRFYGQGLVMPVDQMHSGNPPSHPELLDWLARDTADHDFDLTRLVRGLVLSRAYSRSSRWDSETRPAADLFAVAQVRPLSPMQYGISLRVATESPQTFAKLETLEKAAERAASLSSLGRALASSFTPPSDDFQVSVTESLSMANDSKIADDLLSQTGGRLVGYLLERKSPAEQVEAAYDSILGRRPDEVELPTLIDYLKSRSDRPADAVRQLVWSLLTGSEMRFNY